jgi:hypothetical protein
MIAKTRTRAKLTRDGVDFLTSTSFPLSVAPAHPCPDYARTVNSYPHKPEKEAVLASLHAIPGNESYTLQSLAAWFARHRNPSGASSAHVAGAPVLLNDETILFPKLTRVHLQQLRVLYKRDTTPSDGIISFWAGRIGAERAEIEAWIQYQQEKAKEHDSPDIPLKQLVGESASSPTAPEFSRHHLPTPSESLSPSTSPLTRMPSLPPIAVKVEDLQPVATPLFNPNRLEGLPPLSRLHTTVRPLMHVWSSCSASASPQPFPAPCYASGSGI